MSTAAPPAAAPPVKTASAEPPGPTVLPLPAGLAAAVDALNDRPVHPVRARHPRTGEVFRLVPEAVARATAAPVGVPTPAAAPEESAAGVGRPFTPAEKAEYDAGVSDTEAILEGIAEADAGLCRPWEEGRAALLAEFPFLTDHDRGPDPADPVPADGPVENRAGVEAGGRARNGAAA